MPKINSIYIYIYIYIYTYLLIYSLVQSPSWEANWFAANQEIPRISWNPKVYYHTQKRPPPISILGPPNPVHIPTSYLLEIHHNIIHPSTPRPPQWYIHTYIYTYIHTYIYIHTYTHFMHTYIYTYIRTYIHTYTHTYIHTHKYIIHTYIHTYIHTHTDTYIIYIYIFVCVCVCVCVLPADRLVSVETCSCDWVFFLIIKSCLWRLIVAFLESHSHSPMFQY